MFLNFIISQCRKPDFFYKRKNTKKVKSLFLIEKFDSFQTPILNFAKTRMGIIIIIITSVERASARRTGKKENGSVPVVEAMFFASINS